jgi:hypothetical protein
MLDSCVQIIHIASYKIKFFFDTSFISKEEIFLSLEIFQKAKLPNQTLHLFIPPSLYSNLFSSYSFHFKFIISNFCVVTEACYPCFTRTA